MVLFSKEIFFMFFFQYFHNIFESERIGKSKKMGQMKANKKLIDSNKQKDNFKNISIAFFCYISFSIRLAVKA